MTMLGIRSVSVAFVLSVVLSSGSLTAQLTLSFADHRGTFLQPNELTPLRNGNWEGTLTLPAGSPPLLSYVWAYYRASDSSLFTYAPGESHAHTMMYHVGEGDALMIGTPDSQSQVVNYDVSLPYGHTPADTTYITLPIGSFDLRIWVGEPGTMQDQFPNPPASYLYEYTVPVVVQDPEFEVWVDNPRDMMFGQSHSAYIVRSSPAPQSETFVLNTSGFPALTISQVVILAGETSSASFTVNVDAPDADGLIYATRVADSKTSTSPSLRSTSELSIGGTQGSGTTYQNKFCARHAAPIPWMTRQFCGKCVDPMTSTPQPHAFCSWVQTSPGPFYTKPRCDPGEDTCPIVSKWMEMGTYAVQGQFNNVVCGSITASAEGGFKLLGEAKVGGQVSINLLMVCCVIAKTGTQEAWALDCQ